MQLGLWVQQNNYRDGSYYEWIITIQEGRVELMRLKAHHQ